MSSAPEYSGMGLTSIVVLRGVLWPYPASARSARALAGSYPYSSGKRCCHSGFQPRRVGWRWFTYIGSPLPAKKALLISSRLIALSRAFRRVGLMSGLSGYIHPAEGFLGS